MPAGQPNGSHKPSLHPAAYPMPRAIPPYHGGPQPYAIPTRGVHGPIGGVPHVPQPGSRGFAAGRGGNAGGPIGSHVPYQQGPQQPIGATMGSNFNFPSLENPTSQPSVGGPGPLSQPGYVSNVSISFYTTFYCLNSDVIVASVC